MADVGFKWGNQSNLNNITASNLIPGTFYLTTDTNRLYLAKEVTNNGSTTNELVELNKSITVVDYINTSASEYSSGDTVLPTTGVANGQFYYVKNENILCVYLNSNWVQINPDTNTTYTITTASGNASSPYSIGIDDGHGNVDSTITKFYSSTQVDSLIADATKLMNAMQYKGTIASTSALTTIISADSEHSSRTNCHVGDTYIVSTDGVVYSNKTFNTGDLIILNGTEDSDGYITTATITVEGIPAPAAPTQISLQWSSF